MQTNSSRRGIVAALVAFTAAAAGTAGIALGSDHQDTPEVELNPNAGHDRRLRVSQLRPRAGSCW